MNTEPFFKMLMKARRLAWLVGVLYVMACVALGLEFDPTNRNQWIMAASLGTIVVVSWIIYPLLKKLIAYRQNLLEEIQLGHIDKALGIRKIYPNGMARKVVRDNLSRSDLKSVKILANSAKTYLVLYAADLWPTLLESREVKIQVLIAKEGTEFIREAAQMESINVHHEDPISGSIADVKHFLADKAQKSNRRDFIEIRQFHSQIRANLLIIDDQYCWYTPHLPPVSPMNSFTFELTQTEPDHGRTLFRSCLDHFQLIWDQSENDRVPVEGFDTK